MGAFHSTQKSALNLRQLTVAKRVALSKIFKKKDNLASVPKFLKIISRKFFFFHSILLPEFLEFSFEWFVFRKLNSSRNFWKLSREIFEPFAAASKFSKVLVQCKAPSYIRQLPWPLAKYHLLYRTTYFHRCQKARDDITQRCPIHTKA